MDFSRPNVKNIDIQIESEKHSNWKNFIKSIFDILSNINLNSTWFFDKGINLNFKLLNADKDQPFIRKLTEFNFSNCNNLKDRIDAIVIFTPEDLSEGTVAAKSLISEIVEKNLFEIQFNDGKYSSIHKPILVICNKIEGSHILNNSSIWFKAISITSLKSKQYSNSIESSIMLEIGRIKKEIAVHPYNNVNAQEILDYQLRLQKENHLNRFGNGHVEIIPKMYISEEKCRNDIQSKNYSDNKLFSNVGFRILLIDDKIYKDCGAISKAEALKKLISCNIDTFGLKNENLVWNIGHVKEKISENISGTVKWCQEASNIKIGENHITQIVQVDNITDALKLLASDEIKFDVILLDYLLDRIDPEDNTSKRELATNLFLWLKQDISKIGTVGFFPDNKLLYLYNNLVKGENINEYKNDCKYCHDIIKRHIIGPKQNRGPLNKLWIFPITAFNQTMIEDLISNGIRLIDYYWHISRGADPITTPIRFIKNFNLFLHLQLEYAIFNFDSISKFVSRNLEGLKKLNEDGKIDTSKFQAYMGAEYSVFVSLYFKRPVIYRDKEKSLFSMYVWDNFMKKQENESLFSFTEAFQEFLYLAAFKNLINISEHKKSIHNCIYILNDCSSNVDQIINNLKNLSKLVNSLE